MELRTQAVDRLLEALAPALATELERIMRDAQQQLEEEFQKRLQTAVRDAETATDRMAQVRLEQAVSEARETVKRQITEELQAQFAKTLQQTSDQLRGKHEDEVKTLSTNWNDEHTRLKEQLDQWRVFAEAQKQLAECTSQAEILARFLKLAEPFASSVGLYVVKGDGLSLWKSRGKGSFPDHVSQDTIDPEFYFKPIIIREKTVAAVCAAQPFKVEALDFLTICLERAVEIFGLKLRSSVPHPKQEGTAAPSAATASAAAPGSAPLDSADEKHHAEARRTARLLISEIKLYNERDVQDGRTNSDLYRRLEKQIEQGREQYKQRVHATVLSGRDYFHEELVRVLADGDASRLGPMKS